MSSEESHMILDILEKIDTDGLLDQPVKVAASVFSQSSSDQHEVSSTLRSLLDQSNDVSLRHIYKASQNFAKRVAPNSLSRSALSDSTRRFCDLLDQLLSELVQSKTAVSGQRIDLDMMDNDGRGLHQKTPYYALFQQLGPAGTYFSSAAKFSRDQLTKLSLGQAETVAIVPTQLLPPMDLPPLGSLVSHRLTKPRPVEQLSTVRALRYEPFASFAPTYTTEAAEVGLYETILAHDAASCFRAWEKRNWPAFRRLRETKGISRSKKGRYTKVERESFKATKRVRDGDDDGSDKVKRRKVDEQSTGEAEEVALSPGPPGASTTVSLMSAGTNTSLLDEELLQEVNWVLGNGDSTCPINQILRETAGALEMLRTLQDIRLRGDGRLGEDSTEFDLADAIDANLSALVMWQPRSSKAPTSAPLVPALPALSMLQNALPLGPVPGYKGILKPNSAALKDDSTVRISTADSLVTASQSAYTGTLSTQHRYGPRQTAYTPGVTYTASQAASYPPVYAAQTYGSQSHYAGAYGTNTNMLTATGYSGYTSPRHAYPTYPGYSYGVGSASYSTTAYPVPQPQSGAPRTVPQAGGVIQGWNYAGQGPVVALPPHMRAAVNKSSGSTPSIQSYTPWPKA
ncbi:hypothetical protein DACRYDRAFT_116828 [Dacryopinax primogenitus]|uniref:Uncharacterized protein n=1 Tax=Dacryopinax primogenitus (strain DJM 731) TaxID=1858805 RepID=M5FX26_DACPD|nr:uncharacterized protein DACRYDRAFT_116828 [Dacryopinax primogenitus]EJU00979.1 hypothetical protein DACRYDRAFT_116828 [Dacryopinax primogenitus]